jgi:hypothetical protein
LTFVDLLNESVNGLACLNGHILVFLNQKSVELVEQIYIVLRTDEISLQNLKDENLVFGLMLAFGQGGEQEAYYLLLEEEKVLRASWRSILTILELIQGFLELDESRLSECGTYVSKGIRMGRMANGSVLP